jgi:hypothetical protein
MSPLGILVLSNANPRRDDRPFANGLRAEFQSKKNIRALIRDVLDMILHGCSGGEAAS